MLFMKRIHIVILFISLFSYSLVLNAQDDKFFTFGVKIGGNLSFFSGFTHNNYAEKVKPQTGFIAGITGDFAVSRHFTILTALEYVPKNANFKMKYAEISTTIPYYKSKYLQLPIHLGYKLKTSDDSNVIFHLGPYFAYGVNGEITWKDKNTQMPSIADFFSENTFDRFDYGLGIGINIDTKNFALNVGYDLGLKNITGSNMHFPDKDYIDAKDASIKTRSIYITLGYKFRLDR